GLCLSKLLVAAVEPGQNILLNADFEAEQMDFPPLWSQSDETVVFFEASSGPESTGAVIFRSPADTPNSASVRQLDHELVAGETYTISAWVKTKDFKCSHYGVIVHNTGWTEAKGLTKWPADSDGWQRLEQTFSLPRSSNDKYGFAIFASNFTGEVQVARVRLEAVSAKALAGSLTAPSLLQQARFRLVPWEPLLNHIPRSKPQLTLHNFGMARQETCDEHDCIISVNGREIQRKPLQNRYNVVDLAGLAPADYQMQVSVRQRAQNKEIFAQTYNISIVDPPVINDAKHRRLNNFVVQLLDENLGEDSQNLVFDNPREGWVYLGLSGVENGEALQVELSGLGTVIRGDSERPETFRYLPRGRQSLKVSGANANARLQVRAIAEVFNYPACANSQVPQNGEYDWDFLSKYVLPAVTTLNGGNIPDNEVAGYKAGGGRWLANLGTTNPKDANDLLQRLHKAAGIRQEKYDGLTCDEQFFGRSNLIYYTQAMWDYQVPEEKLVYTWIVGKPSVQGVHHDFMSASINACRGRGRLLFEAYNHSRANEEDARSYLENRVLDTMLKFNRYFPNAVANTGMLFGNFNQIPIISLDVNPEVDYKYYLDMQLNLAANNPAFEGLGTIGYWGSYYDDEELYRWSMLLLRHYAVEGRRDMLSEKYGYKYNPGHLRNCDFNQGLDGWQAEPAAEPALSQASFLGYGKDSQRRWGAPSRCGDNFCLFKRQATGFSRISQVASGLVVGQTYTLQFVTADYQDMLQKRFNPRRHPIGVEFSEGAELLPEQSYVFVDRRDDQRAPRLAGKARVNLHHWRFVARNSELSISFHDKEAEPGEELALNYIMLKPYFGK
ncbi:MAG: carbohydrate binding domain-containing protein, partial [Lentisphaeria bacterium]